MSGDFCKDFYVAHWSAIELWFVPIVAVLQCILLSFVIYRSWKQIMRATRDEETGLMTHEDNTSLIFPVYIRMLCLCAIAEFVDGVLTVVVARTGFNFFPESGNVLEISIIAGASFMIYRGAIESMVVMLLMQGMGAKTLRLAVFAAVSSCLLMWSGKTLFYYYANRIIQLAVDGAYCSLYFGVLVSTFCGVGRPALRRFALFFTFYHGLVFIGDLCYFFDRGCSMTFCLEPGSNILFVMVFPWICFTALRADSKFWQGLADDPSFAVTSQSTDVQGPLSGICLAPETASMVAATVDNLNAVPLLNFALLRIDRSKTVKHQQQTLEASQVVVLGAGGNSRVFQGKYDGRPVAIKMLFSPQLTPAVVATFCKEAATLGTLKHPHVVEILGICISPPSVSLVMELCDGTLFDLLHSSDKPIDWELQLRLAYECALAVEYLHSQSPPVLHLDIKSPNFLLSKYGKVKIADLELSRRGRESELSKAGLPDTLNWTAPEALQVKGGKTIIYDEKTDVYSLGCVLWEIVHRKVPYQAFLDDLRKTHLDSPRARRKGEVEPVRLSDYKDSRTNLGDRSPLLGSRSRRLISNAHAEEILANCIVEQQYRPPIEAGTHPEMARIIAEAWQANPQARPTASQIVRALDRLRLSMKDAEKLNRRRHA